jgi:acyl-CoA reductase-like NAD-dependent aldehyde dehydrogenase
MSKNMWFLQGEVCCASSRVFVQEGIYDQVEKKLVEKAKAWIVGDPFDPKTQQGPQVRSKYVLAAQPKHLISHNRRTTLAIPSKISVSN